MFLGMLLVLLRSSTRVGSRCLLMNCSIIANYCFIITRSFSGLHFLELLSAVCSNFLAKLSALRAINGVKWLNLSPISFKLSADLALSCKSRC